MELILTPTELKEVCEFSMVVISIVVAIIFIAIAMLYHVSAKITHKQNMSDRYKYPKE